MGRKVAMIKPHPTTRNDEAGHPPWECQPISRRFRSAMGFGLRFAEARCRGSRSDQRLGPRRSNRYEKVHRCDVVPVISKECAPALTLIAVGISVRETSSDRGNPDEHSELFKLVLNLTSAPSVLIHESANERLHVDWNRRPIRTGLRDRTPVEPAVLGVPAHHSVDLYDDQEVLPSRSGSRQ